jgi:hypothetical protein
MTRNRHDPRVPLPVLCRMAKRIGASGREYFYGFSKDQKFLLFIADDGASGTLCAQPLSPHGRSAVSDIPRTPTVRERSTAEARRRLAEPLGGFVSGLSDAFMRGRR